MLIMSVPLYAQRPNYSISSPPIPWFEFKEGQNDMRISATALYITGKAEELEGDTKIYGGGAGGIYRNAFKDILAFDIGLTLVGASEQVADDVDMSMWLGTIPLDLEFLLVNNERIAIIGFIGFSFTYNSISIDSKVPGSEFTLDMTTSMKGPQGDVQVSFKLGDFTLSPFLILTKQSGDVDIDYDISGSSSVHHARVYCPTCKRNRRF